MLSFIIIFISHHKSYLNIYKWQSYGGKKEKKARQRETSTCVRDVEPSCHCETVTNLINQ